MPCNCDHIEPNYRERESAKVIDLLVEVGLLREDKAQGIYGDVVNLDFHTEQLCDFCQQDNGYVSRCSLELQMWWRDHQKADKERLKQEQMEAKTDEEKSVALKKLSPYERELLGL